jgi:hypothetical protein
VPDEQSAGGERLTGPQPFRADERGTHAEGKQGDDVALKAVADEQHLAGRCLGRGEHELVEDRIRLTDAERVGKQDDAE